MHQLEGECWDIRNVFLVSFFPYIIISLYHSFLISFFPILRMVITLYIYFVHEWMKKLPFINLKMVSEPWNWNLRYFVVMVVRQQSIILRQALILISQPSNALTAIRLIPPVWISHNFKATTLSMTRKTMRNRGFEPWTFKSCLGYHHFVINDNNRDQQKKDSKKTSTATVAEIKTKANVTEKASTLVAATDHMTFDSRQASPVRPSLQKIVSTANGNTTPVIR